MARRPARKAAAQPSKKEMDARKVAIEELKQSLPKEARKLKSAQSAMKATQLDEDLLDRLLPRDPDMEGLDNLEGADKVAVAIYSRSLEKFKHHTDGGAKVSMNRSASAHHFGGKGLGGRANKRNDFLQEDSETQVQTLDTV